MMISKKKRKRKKIKAEKEANEKEEKKEHALIPRTEKQALTTSVSAWPRSYSLRDKDTYEKAQTLQSKSLIP